MNGINPKTLPNELITIAYYYACQTKLPFSLASFVKNPDKEMEIDSIILGSYTIECSLINLNLANIQATPSIWLWVQILPESQKICEIFK